MGERITTIDTGGFGPQYARPSMKNQIPTKLTPAYGRDYKSAASVHAAWNAEADFIVNDFGHHYEGKPINKQQLPEGAVAFVRFNNLKSVTPVTH